MVLRLSCCRCLKDPVCCTLRLEFTPPVVTGKCWLTALIGRSQSALILLRTVTDLVKNASRYLRHPRGGSGVGGGGGATQLFVSYVCGFWAAGFVMLLSFSSRIWMFEKLFV